MFWNLGCWEMTWKAGRPTWPRADVLVAVDAGGEGFFGVVEVPDFDVFEADDLVELLEDGVGGVGGGDVVTGGEDVAGVDADGDAVIVFDGLAHFGEVFEGAAEAGTLAGGGFEADGDLSVFLLVEDLVEGGGDAGDAALFAGAAVGAGVDDEVGDAEVVAAFHFVGEGGDGFLPEAVVDGGEIDEVGGVGDDVVEVEAVGVGAEEFDGGGVEGFGGPLLLVFGEDLDGLEVELFGGEEGVFHSAGD